MTADPFIEADEQIQGFSGILSRGETGFKYLPSGLKAILRTGAWRKRRIRTGAVVEFDSFEEFITTPPLEGIGGDLSLIRRIVSADVEALDLLDRACQKPHGGDRKSEDAIKCTDAPLDEKPKSRAGRDLRRLRKDAPEVHSRVLSGEISPHAGMVEAGFRKRPAPYETLCRSWEKTPSADRERFLETILVARTVANATRRTP